MTTGRPPLPVEVKRRRGRTTKTDSGGRALPVLAEVVNLPQADGTPTFPPDLGEDGQRLWRRIWQNGLTWISPHSDIEAAEQACRAADDVGIAQRRYRATTDPSDARALVALAKRLDEALSALGFNPTARSRLGVAEVVRVSKLDALRRRNQA
jgi:hypothetical protein